MLRKTLFNIIRQEKQEVEGQIQEEERRQSPDRTRICVLREKASSLGRELAHFPDL